MKILYLTILAVLLVALVGCQNTTEPEEQITETTPEQPEVKQISCGEEPRPELCTMDYLPVCGSDGQTYSNGCTACSNKLVQWYTEGEC